MNIETVRQDDHQAKITVEFPKELFESYKHRAAKKISKQTKIPGFRPGKAPYNVVVSNYGEATVIQEAIDLLLDEQYPKVLDEAEITPSGPGNLESVESYDPPKFVFLVPLEPEVALGNYREVRKDYELEEFDLAKVDDFIFNLRRNAATIIPSDDPAAEGDLVYFTLSGEWLNPDEEDDATITDKTPQQIIVPAEDEVSEEEWPYPGFSRELLGVKAGDVKEIQHTYPEDYPDEDMRGQTAIFSVEVQSVKELELPEFDEAFIETLGDYDSPESFRESVESRMRKEHQAEYDRAFFNEVLEAIHEITEMKYPPQMLEHETEHVLEDIKGRLKNQNLDFETYLKIRETDEETFIEEEAKPVARERLERSLLIDALVEAEELKIDQDALQAQVNELLTELFYSGNYQEMQKEMGQEELSRAISQESVTRTMNAQIQERLKLIATGQPIPEDEPQSDEGEEKEAESDEAETPASDTVDEMVETEGEEVSSKNESDHDDNESSENPENGDES